MNFSVNGAFITFAYAEEVRIHQFWILILGLDRNYGFLSDVKRNVHVPICLSQMHNIHTRVQKFIRGNPRISANGFPSVTDAQDTS